MDEFARIARERHGHHIDAWIARPQTSGIPAVRSFADGLAKDYDAVRAGLTRPGAPEPSRARALKRQMYGRATSAAASSSAPDDHGICARASFQPTLTASANGALPPREVTCYLCAGRVPSGNG